MCVYETGNNGPGKDFFCGHVLTDACPYDGAVIVIILYETVYDRLDRFRRIDERCRYSLDCHKSIVKVSTFTVSALMSFLK